MMEKRRPLYASVGETLRRRVRDGHWKPGEALPNEFELADELGVSQGTVRKALEDLVATHLVERRQGLGTFVATHTPKEMLFRFFRLVDSDGRPVIPDSELTSLTSGRASASERSRLRLGPAARVVRIVRVRLHTGRPFIRETIVLPLALFPGLEKASTLPNTLYAYYQSAHGVTIVRAEECLATEAADEDDSKALKLAPGSPLLVIDRIAFGIDGEPIEWRVSRCWMDGRRYVVALS